MLAAVLICNHMYRHYGPVHAMPEKFENAASLLRLGLPSAIICHENEAYRKRSSKRRNLKMPHFVLAWTENIVKTYLFENDDNKIIM